MTLTNSRALTAFLQFLNRSVGLKNRSNVIEGFSGKPLRETPAGKLGAKIAKGICPDCGSKKGFYKGPSGGMSTNIFCANSECRSGFNFTPMFGEGHAERIHKGLDRYYD